MYKGFKVAKSTQPLSSHPFQLHVMSGELEIPRSGVYTPPPPQCAHFKRSSALEALKKLFCSFIYWLLSGFRWNTGLLNRNRAYNTAWQYWKYGYYFLSWYFIIIPSICHFFTQIYLLLISFYKFTWGFLKFFMWIRICE